MSWPGRCDPGPPFHPNLPPTLPQVTKLAEEMVAQGADAARAILASGSPAAAAGGAAPRAALPPKAPRGGEALNPSKLAALVERAPCFVLLDFRCVCVCQE